jgi:hypothetical protein
MLYSLRLAYPVSADRETCPNKTNNPRTSPKITTINAPFMKLTEHNLEILTTILKYRLMSTEQVYRAAYAQRTDQDGRPIPATVRAVANTLKRLHLNGFVGRDWADPKRHTRETPARPSAIWFLEKKHFEKLCENLAENSRADLCEDLAAFAHVIRDGSALAANTLRHELAITEFYMALDQAAPTAGRHIPLWLRTSPRHPDISRTVTATKTDKKTQRESKLTLPLNPDGFHVVHRPDKGCAFFLLEMDMNTETNAEKITRKFLAYYAYYEQNTFGQEIAAPFAQKYRLPITRPEAAPFRVLFVAPNTRRRNDLLLKSRVLPTSNLFHFATLDDVLADPFGPAWLCKESFKDHLDEFNARTHTDNPALLRSWAHAILNGLPKRSL